MVFGERPGMCGMMMIGPWQYLKFVLMVAVVHVFQSFSTVQLQSPSGACLADSAFFPLFFSLWAKSVCVCVVCGRERASVCVCVLAQSITRMAIKPMTLIGRARSIQRGQRGDGAPKRGYGHVVKKVVFLFFGYFFVLGNEGTDARRNET